MKYVVIFEEDENGCSAYVPDLPGCIAAGDTIDEVRILIAEAIDFHIEGLQEDGETVPLPISSLPIEKEPGVSSALITARAEL